MSRPFRVMSAPGRECSAQGVACLFRRIYHLGHPGASPACGFCGVLAAAAPASHAESYYSRVDAPGAQPGLAPYLCGMVSDDPLAALRDRPVMAVPRRGKPPVCSTLAKGQATATTLCRGPYKPRKGKSQEVKPAPPRTRDEALARALEWVRTKVARTDAQRLPLGAVLTEFNRLAGECGFREYSSHGMIRSLRARGLAVYRRVEGWVLGDTARLRAWCGKQTGR